MTSLRTLALAATFLSAIALPALAQGSATPAPVAPGKGVTVNAPVHKASGTAAATGTTGTTAGTNTGTTAGTTAPAGTVKPTEGKTPATATAKPAAPATGTTAAKPAAPAPVTKTN